MPKRNVKQRGAAVIGELLKLRRMSVKLTDVYLDPNNPRFGENSSVEDERVAEEEIQARCQDKIEGIGITDLLTSFQQHGFVQTDPIVTRKAASNVFVVVEGNRRTATLKKLVRAYRSGEVSLPTAIVDSFEKFEALLYEGDDPNISWLLQGLRHMSGIKEWPPFQQGVFLAKIEQELSRGRLRPPTGKVAKAAGVGPGRAARLLRSHHAYAQAAADEEFGERITEDKFGMFNEAVFASPLLQQWLGWNEDSRQFDSVENLKLFLSWITPSDSDGQPRISRAVDARDVLPGIVADPVLLTQFEANEIGLDQARVEIQKKRSARPEDLNVLVRRLDEVLSTLDSLPTPQVIRDARQADFIPKLENIGKTVELHLRVLRS